MVSGTLGARVIQSDGSLFAVSQRAQLAEAERRVEAAETQSARALATAAALGQTALAHRSNLDSRSSSG